MIFKNEGESFTYGRREFAVGADVICNENSVYSGLGGKIIEIRTGDDKETNNPTIEIVVKLIPPALPSEIERYKERFCCTDADFSCGLIMAPCQLELFSNNGYSKMAIYTLVESWAYEGGTTDSKVYLFPSMPMAKAKLNECYQMEIHNIPNFWMKESGETFIEFWEEGYHAGNYYKLEIYTTEFELSSKSMSSAYSYMHYAYCLEDAHKRLQSEEYAAGLSEAEEQELLNDILAQKIDRDLSKNDAYLDAYWSSVDSVLREEIESKRNRR